MENEVMNEIEEKATDLIGRGIAAVVGVAAGVGATIGVQKILKMKGEKPEEDPKEVTEEQK